MADAKITQLTTLSTIEAGDLVPMVDINDATMAASGTTKKTDVDDLVAYIQQNVDAREQTTGTAVVFLKEQVYGTNAAPESGNITVNQTNAVLGVVQKMYHNSGTPPTVTGVSDVQIIGDGVYFTSQLNIIYLEWTETNRVEYWVVQEQ